MSLRPRRTTPTPLIPALRLYLETGDYTNGEGQADLDVYRLAGTVIRGNLAPLAALWAMHGAEILAGWTAKRRPWAEQKLGALASASHTLNGDGA